MMKRRLRITYSPEALYTKGEVEKIISYINSFRLWTNIFKKEKYFPGILGVEPSIRQAREIGLADFPYGKSVISDLESCLRDYNIEHNSD